MRIAVDVREACRKSPTGKGRWTYGFVTELLKRSGLHITLLSDDVLPATWKGADTVRFSSGISWHIRAGNWLKREWPLYISPTSFIIPAFGMSRLKTVPVVHDLIAFGNEPHDHRARRIEHWTVPRALRKAAHILTISDTTAQALHAKFPQLPAEKMTTVYAGPTTDPLPRSEATPPVIVCIGTLCPRKNQLRLINAFAALPSLLRGDARLVLVGGRGWDDDAIIRAAHATPGVTWAGYMNDAEWKTLFASARLLAFPSLEEGFGLPILDAFRQGVPVLTSDRGSMREIADGGALLVNPEDTESMTKGLAVLLTDDETRTTLVEIGKKRAQMFTWENTVNRALEAFKTVAAA